MARKARSRCASCSSWTTSDRARRWSASAGWTSDETQPRRAERSQAVTTSDAHRAIDAVWRIESAKVIAGLARITGDVGLAEDLAQDALLAALDKWPQSGIPDNPGAWLMATAKHRAIDMHRRSKLLERKHEEMVPELEERQELRR